MAESSVRFTGGTLTTRLAQFDARMDRAVAGALLYHASRGKAYAQQNAPWQDQTGAARNGLFARVDRTGAGKYALTFGHSVPYGIWLEVRFSGRYAVIRPTIDHTGPELMRTLTQVFNTM